MEPDDEHERRRAARAGWPTRVVPLHDQPPDDLSATTTPEQRVAMMWPLALDAWAAAGRPLPTYTRAETPGRIRSLMLEAKARREG